MNISEQASEISNSLNELRLFTSRRHLRQAVSAMERGDWEAANSQTRTFFESLCEGVAHALHFPFKGPLRGNARKSLVEKKFLSEMDGKLLSDVFSLLSGQGSHPGESDEADCVRRLGLVLVLAEFYLHRLRRRVQLLSDQRLAALVREALGPLGSISSSGKFESADYDTLYIGDEAIFLRIEKVYSGDSVDQYWVNEFVDYLDHWNIDEAFASIDGTIPASENLARVDVGIFQYRRTVYTQVLSALPSFRAGPSFRGEPIFIVEVPRDLTATEAVARLRRGRDFLAGALSDRKLPIEEADAR